MAIVYGGETDYILCVMSEGGSSSAITTIQKISATVYDYLNGTDYAKEVENEEETGGMTKASGSGHQITKMKNLRRKMMPGREIRKQPETGIWIGSRNCLHHT